MKSAVWALALLTLVGVSRAPIRAIRAIPAEAAQGSRLRLSVQLVDAELFVRPVPRHVLLLKPVGREGDPIRIVVGFDGRADIAVPVGDFTLESERPAIFQGHAYRWKQPVSLKPNETLAIDLSVDTALIDGNPTPADPPAATAAGRGEPVPDPPAPAAPRTALPTLVGEWVGTYAGVPARLTIDRNDGAAFSGTLRVFTKAGSAGSEILIDGQWDQTRGSIDLKEVKVASLGAASTWNLGTGSGTLRDGREMRGTGKDGKKSYDWSLTRQIAAAMAAAAAEPAPSAGSSAVDLVGSWEGMYADSPARLSITRQTGAEFGGVLTVTTRSGQAPTEIQVEGRLNQTTIELRETSVTTIGAARTWNLGRGSGTLPAGGRQMTGTGNDGRTSYKWSFTKR